MLASFILRFLDFYFSEQSRWIHWLPVGLILGILTYFSLQNEPTVLSYMGTLSLASLSFIHIKKYPQYKLIPYIIVGFCVGFCISGIQTHFNRTPMFKEVQISKNISGYIESIENHPYKDNDSCRIILDHIKIDHIAYPARLRLNIYRETTKNLQIGDKLTIAGKIYPIPMPCSIHGYFARRAAFLQRIGGTINITEFLSCRKAKVNSFKQLRFNLTRKLLENLDRPYGSIAAALVTGDRSYIPKELRQSFIDAGLAHVLAISGLHLSIIAGLVFLLLRRLVCLVPVSLTYFSAKKVSACLTILATMFYMALANFGIPVQRSFIMITLAMLAICLDRTAFSMRSLSIAAFFILVIAPESVLSASFQLSFIAVLGLLAFYESAWFNIREKVFKNTSDFLGAKKILMMLLGILGTTIIASIVTTPYSISFFQRFTTQAILGNLLAIPIISLIVMPLGLLSVLSLMFYKKSIFFWFWNKSLTLLCLIAEKISLLPGASIQVEAVPSYILLMFSMGMLWICIWRKFWRWAGLIPIVCSIVLWKFSELPIAYINAKNDIMAYKNNNVMHVSSLTRNTFATNNWAQEWGISKVKEWKYLYHFLDEKTLLIVSPKEALEYLHKKSHANPINTIITFGYEKTLKKHGFKIHRVIDRNIIQYEEGLAIYSCPIRILFLKDYFGSRPWCTKY